MTTNSTIQGGSADPGAVVAGVIVGSAAFIMLSICAAICVHYTGRKLRRRRKSTLRMKPYETRRRKQKQQQQEEDKGYVLYENLQVNSWANGIDAGGW